MPFHMYVEAVCFILSFLLITGFCYFLCFDLWRSLWILDNDEGRERAKINVTIMTGLLVFMIWNLDSQMTGVSLWPRLRFHGLAILCAFLVGAPLDRLYNYTFHVCECCSRSMGIMKEKWMLFARTLAGIAIITIGIIFNR